MRTIKLLLGLIDFIVIVFAILVAYQVLIGPLDIYTPPAVKQQVERPLPQWDKSWQ